MRCVHVNHMRSSVPYRLKGGAETISVPIVMGYNKVRRNYEMCDEGLIHVRTVKTKKAKKKVTPEEV